MPAARRFVSKYEPVRGSTFVARLGFNAPARGAPLEEKAFRIVIDNLECPQRPWPSQELSGYRGSKAPGIHLQPLRYPR